MRQAAALALVFLLVAGTVSGATFESVSDSQLVDRSQLVVVGHVLGSTQRVRGDGTIVTDYRLAVEEVLKGQAGATVTITEVGGSANGIALVIPGSARYSSGSRVMAFLKQRDDGTYFTASMSLGAYRFKTQRDLSEVLVRDEDGAEVDDPAAFTPRRADAFVKYVRDIAKGVATAEPLAATLAPPSIDRFLPETNVASDYVVKDGSPLRPIRWQGCESGCTIDYKVNNSQPGPTDVLGGIGNAMASWTNDPFSFVTMSLTGVSGVTNVAAAFDNENTIVLDNTASPNVGTCDGTLACGLVWLNDGTCGASNCHVFNGETFYTALGGDAIIRPNVLTQSVFETVVAHELGHTIAFKHAPTSGNLMSPSIPATPALRSWDKEAMAVVYGNGLPCAGATINSTTSSGTVPEGNTKTLTVNASGTAPLTYQWYEGTSGTTTSPVGTNSSAFTTPAITQPRSYWVKVSNDCGTANSNTITISPSAPTCTPPAITVQPLSQTILAGSTANLSVDASGTATLTYQWYRGALGDTSNPVSTSKNFTTPALSATTSYWARVTNGCGTANSNLATITVTPQQECVPASITTQPFNTATAIGEGITLAIGTAGTAPLSFQWYTGESPDTSSPIAGATTNSYAAGPFNIAGTYKFWVHTMNSCGQANSATISVSVACPGLLLPLISAPAIAPAPAAYDVSWEGSAPSLISSYELQEATNADFTADLRTFIVSGATHRHIDAHSEVTVDKRFYYRVRATNACNGSVTAFSVTTSTLVTAPQAEDSTTFSISVPDGVNQGFPQNYLVPGFGESATPSDTFSITIGQNCRPDLLPACVPWLTVFPQNGSLSAGGTTVQFTYNTSGLDIGTLTTTITVNRTNGSAAKVGTNATTPSISIPFSVSVVTPVSPAPRGANAPAGTLIIPAIAHADGIGTRFQSDVRIANTSGQAITYELSFTPSGNNGTSVGKRTTITIAGHDTKGLDDIVKAWYGSGVLGESGLGTLEIRPVGEVNPLATFASSRTYAISAAGTLGQFIPAIPVAQFAGNIGQNPLARLSLQQVANSSAYRTNFGFVEGSGQSAQMLIKLLDGNNNVLQSVTKSLQPYEHQQLSFASLFGNVPVNDARVEVTSTSSTGKVTAYASVVDNRTSDPLLVVPVQAAAILAQHYIAAGIAELNNGSSNFHSDMRIYNGGANAIDVALRYYPQGSSTPNSTVVPKTIQPGQVLALDNVLPELWGLDASGGAVTVDAPSESSLVVTARTYSRNAEGGTFGQFIPGVSSSDGVGFGERSLELLQLEQSDQYRTNLGLFEVTGRAVDLEITATKPDTKLTVVAPYHLEANQFVQLGFVFRDKFNMPNVYNGRISIRVAGGEGRVAAYGSVVDNRTIDPTYVPAQ
jgi:hypothetical protein